MGLADLHTIDIVTHTDDGGECWILVARWPAEDDARRIALFLLKLAAHEQYAAQQDNPVRMELISPDEPPACVVEIATRRQIAAFVGEPGQRAPATGRSTAYPIVADEWPDIDALQAANAGTCAQLHALPRPPTIAGLSALDAVLVARREEAGLGDDDESDDAFDGELILLAGAYTGEAIRGEVGGMWRYDPEAAIRRPIFLAVGPAADVLINPLGKAMKFLREGASKSVESLATAVVSLVRDRSSR